MGSHPILHLLWKLDESGYDSGVIPGKKFD